MPSCALPPGWETLSCSREAPRAACERGVSLLCTRSLHAPGMAVTSLIHVIFSGSPRTLHILTFREAIRQSIPQGKAGLYCLCSGRP